MSCAKALLFHLVLVAWFYCMFVWVCPHVIRLGHHVVFTGLLVWRTARFRNLCILFLFVAVLLLLQVVFIKLLPLPHGSLLHFLIFMMSLLCPQWQARADLDCLLVSSCW